MRRATLPVLLALSLAVSPVAAAAAPVSDGSYQAAVEALAASIGRSQDVQRDRGLSLGGVVVPIDRSRPTSALVRSLSALPESHLSPYSSIKSQVGNTCWAYATVGALESNLLAQRGVGGSGTDAVDFSEAQVVYGTYNGATEDGTPDGAERTDSDNDHFVTDDGAYGFLTPSSPLIASGSLAAGRGVSYEGDVPVVGDAATFRVDETAAGAAANYSLSRLRLDSVTVLPGTFVAVDDDNFAAGLTRDDAMLDAWKRAILESGAVAVVYFAPLAPDAVLEYYHPDADEAFGDAGADADVFRTYPPNYWMYDPDRADFDDVMAGHVVTLVGWDDSYSRWNFATPLVREDGTERPYDPDVATVEERDGVRYIVPRGDGAFVAKNSWGESFAYDGGSEEIGDGGTFRFSYWEATLSVGVALDLDSAEGGSSYDIVQQYDGAAPDEYLETGGVALEGANVFRAEGDQELEALGLWTYENATDVDVRVYVGLTDPDDPESGTLACEQRSRLDFGYHTLELDSPVSVSEGEPYSVVVGMSAELGDGEAASVLPLECSENAAFGDEVQIYSSEGESFVSRSEGGEDGVWVDTADVVLASGARVGNLAVKAFSNSVAGSGDGGGADGGDQGQGTGDGQTGGEQAGGDQGDGGQDEGAPGEGGGQSGGDQATGDSQTEVGQAGDDEAEGGQAGGGQIGEDASARRPAADAGSSAPSDGEPLAATSDGSPRPLPLAALGACALACPVVLLVRRRLSSR